MKKQIINISILCLICLLTLHSAQGQVKDTTKLTFTFKNRPSKNVNADLEKALNNKPKSEVQTTNIKIQAVVLTEKELNIMPKLIGRNVDDRFMVSNNLTIEYVSGMIYSASIVSRYVALEKEYQERLGAANIKGKGQVNREWAEITAGALAQFQMAGLKVSTNDLSKWTSQFKQRKLNVLVDDMFMKGSKVGNAHSSELSCAAKAVPVSDWQPTEKRGLMTGIYKINPCKSPLAAGTITKSYNSSYQYNISIPYWCGPWYKPWRDICYRTVNVCTFSINMGLNITYRLDCCGGYAYANGYFTACAGSACLNCNATSTSVVSYGAPIAGTTKCAYGFVININVRCNFLGFNIINYNMPAWGYSISGPCHPC